MAALRVTCSGALGCGESWAGLKLEHCTTCHRTFTTTRAGDWHRAGPWSERRCLSDEELLAKGKVVKNSRGHWARPPRIEAAAGDEAPVNHQHEEIHMEEESAA